MACSFFLESRHAWRQSPMIINVPVATLAVDMKKASNLDDFVELDEPLYALSFLWLLLSGSG